MSYLGTRLVSFSSILKRKNTATALRIVRLFARWTRKPCARIIRLCYVPRKKIYKCINRLSYDSWSTDFSTAVSFKLISAYALEWIRTKPVYFILSEHIILSLKTCIKYLPKTISTLKTSSVKIYVGDDCIFSCCRRWKGIKLRQLFFFIFT